MLVAAESRTSSPVRIPREKKHYKHPEIARLFPCAEGAGYAGGIVPLQWMENDALKQQYKKPNKVIPKFTSWDSLYSFFLKCRMENQRDVPARSQKVYHCCSSSHTSNWDFLLGIRQSKVSWNFLQIISVKEPSDHHFWLFKNWEVILSTEAGST